ncbi:MAG: hypothetical protein KJ066_16230 [Acidobacteria bacterium]|nr:hypothetical protein [Acidobacteriota bacterium]
MTTPNKTDRPEAIAFHGTTDDGDEVVGFGNIRVVLQKDDDGWFAQGLEVDYAAEGDSLEEVKRAFEQGFFATIDTHLRMFGGIEGLLRPAPVEVWTDVLTNPSQIRRFSHISLHQLLLPFQGIEYFTEGRARG